MGGKGEGRLPFRKKEGRDSNTSGASPLKFFQGVVRHKICMCLPQSPREYARALPTHARTIIPAVFEEHYKTARMAPLLLIWIRCRGLLDVSRPFVILNNFRCKSACECVHHRVMYGKNSFLQILVILQTLDNQPD